ncbi:hypothetical protein, partial [Microcoleus sp. Z1_B5]|uniref:hypothetical protein n=1 Tax=Microcoleus sp. Z1_B5 TaxID=3055430 RepID=UPI002FD644E2
MEQAGKPVLENGVTSQFQATLAMRLGFHPRRTLPQVRESMAECPLPSLLQNRACDFHRTR